MLDPPLLDLEIGNMKKHFYNNNFLINKISLSFNFSHLNFHIFHRIMFFLYNTYKFIFSIALFIIYFYLLTKLLESYFIECEENLAEWNN